MALPLAAQELSRDAMQMNRWFHEAAAEFDVPVEVLQSIAYVESRWSHRVVPHRDRELPGGLRTERAERDEHEHQPAAYGVMGLRDDDHFGHSLLDAAALIARTPDELRRDARLNIRGAAALLAQYGAGLTRNNAVELWEPAVARLSGIPQPSIAQMHTYDVFKAIVAGRAAEQFRIAQREISLDAIYGAEQLAILSAPRLTIDVDTRGRDRIAGDSADYTPAIWDPAATCNYGAGRSSSVTHIAEHIAQGSYAGTISWFKNCSASVSAHYVVRSSDGQVTQMVRESDTAWHVASHNSYSVGIEHEGYADNCAWYTAAMYNGSSALTRDIADSHGIPRTATYDASLGWDTELPQSSSFKIKGHTNFPTTKLCPGSCFDWPRFRSLVIGSAWSSIVDNTTAGRFTASANWAVSSYSTQRYGTDYRYAAPVAASDTAWFKFDIPTTANYEVFVWYPANAGYNAATPFVVATSSGNVTRTVNQQVNGGTWVSIGVHHLNAGDYNAVGVSRWTSGTAYVIADAVKLVRQ
jgi:N-acetyl-anhydromuramyl-L-alanine amidase AmpD